MATDADFNPRSMDWTARQLSASPVPVEGKIETCRTVFPKFDLGQWRTLGVFQYFTYATIEYGEHREWRGVYPVDRFKDELAILQIGDLPDRPNTRTFAYPSSARPFPLE